MDQDEIKNYKKLKISKAQKKYRNKSESKEKNIERCKKYYNRNQTKLKLKARLKYFINREKNIRNKITELENKISANIKLEKDELQ